MKNIKELYAVRYETKNGDRYYREPNERDLENEQKIEDIVLNEIENWQNNGLIPSIEIEPGVNTDQIDRERGWRYWHQLFNSRQLLTLALLNRRIQQECEIRRADYEKG